jgi:hypothetical protein
MVTQIFETISSAVTEFIGVLTSALGGVVDIFWNATDNTMTPLGVILLVGLGVGLAYFALSFLIRAIRNVGKAN